jgi:hypothetical protein
MMTRYFDGEERRVHVRYGRELWARYRVQGREPPVWLEAQVQNMSHTGLCLAIVADRKEVLPVVDRSDPPNLEIEVPLDAEGNDEATGMLKTVAAVKWLKKPGLLTRTLLVGLKFEKLPYEMEKLLHEYISAQFVGSYKDYREQTT